MKEQNALRISGAVGLPLKIDPLTSSLYHGLYTRVLVDLDFAIPLLGKILVKMINQKINFDIVFFVSVLYERLAKFFYKCCAFTHDTQDYKNITRTSYDRRDDRDHRKSEQTGIQWRDQ